MVALVAEALTGADPDTRISRSTIDEFLSTRWTWRPDPELSKGDPMLPVRGLPRPLEWGVVFGSADRSNRDRSEGTFLVESSAEARPGHRVLSIEWRFPYAEHLRDRVRRRGLENVRVARADALVPRRARPRLRTRPPVYFPDPWPKKRHHKRRLMQPGFVAAAAEALEEGGELRFVSDHAEYFEEAREVLSAEPALEEAPALEDEMTDLTNYERKYRAEGRPIHRARFVKRSPSRGSVP